jgi:hypothetical protein
MNNIWISSNGSSILVFWLATASSVHLLVLSTSFFIIIKSNATGWRRRRGRVNGGNSDISHRYIKFFDLTRKCGCQHGLLILNVVSMALKIKKNVILMQRKLLI